ncbi:alpha-ketoglutarate-dependent dioxygenase AlkB family protein [Corallincola platygyrae]|uniref:Alpha-ketoglutarate-dependent dioxygenase AlkB family protein n=1 Tax=Corallincola platygyrae TaxID=1193278 RepID=A0ABW4XJF2_9GAMM
MVSATKVGQQIVLPGASLWLVDQWCADSESVNIMNRLQSELDWNQPEITLFGRSNPIPRLQAWYGDAGTRYRYSGMTMQPEPWQPTLLALKQQLEQTLSYQFNSVLANLYRDGRDSMGWHSDNEPELGSAPVIASLSFGAPRRFQMRHKYQGYKFELVLGAGSLLVMSGVTQQHWQHAVPKQSKVHEPRINLTFRTVRGV